MQLQFRPVTEVEAREILTWRYPMPYQVYDPGPGAYNALLDPRYRYVAGFDEDNVLVGFFCFGLDARVPGELGPGEAADPDTLDVGLGMRPDLTGLGYGLEFVTAGLAYGREHFHPARFRLAVLTFNRRAIAVYVRAGFAPERVFRSPGPGGPREFLMMLREES